MFGVVCVMTKECGKRSCGFSLVDELGDRLPNHVGKVQVLRVGNFLNLLLEVRGKSDRHPHQLGFSVFLHVTTQHRFAPLVNIKLCCDAFRCAAPFVIATHRNGHKLTL